MSLKYINLNTMRSRASRRCLHITIVFIETVLQEINTFRLALSLSRSLKHACLCINYCWYTSGNVAGNPGEQPDNSCELHTTVGASLPALCTQAKQGAGRRWIMRSAVLGPSYPVVRDVSAEFGPAVEELRVDEAFWHGDAVHDPEANSRGSRERLHGDVRAGKSATRVSQHVPEVEEGVPEVARKGERAWRLHWTRNKTFHYPRVCFYRGFLEELA